MKHKIYLKNLLLKANITYTVLLIIANIFTYVISDSNKNIYISFSIFFACLIFFMYRIQVSSLIKSNWNDLKKEVLYINYPITVFAFFALIFIILLTNIGILYNVNPDAFNSTFIFTLFMSTISMLFPSILLLVYMYLVCPAFVIPSYEGKNKNRKKKTDILVLLLFMIFLIFSGIQFITSTINYFTISSRTKFRAVKLPVEYSRNYLKYTNFSDYTKEQLKNQELDIPFLYTSEGFRFKTYEEAENFCHSINAEVGSHLEIYNIIFHRFDTFGERYYWTKDKAGKYNLLLHFKNMSYKIVRAEDGIKPIAYCTAKTNKNHKIFNEKYFYKVKPVKIETGNKKVKKKYIDTEKRDIEKQQINIEKTLTDDILKHVNFNVKEVDNTYFNSLLNKGYIYNKELKINAYYASSPQDLDESLNRDINLKNIRLCYYPFLDYENMTRINEGQIWKQSFCSPSFNVIKIQPVLKTKYEKDSYCYANGGRLPNIPELMGILRTFNINSNNTVYWTNNKISNYQTNGISPVAIEVNDERFAIAKTINQNEAAYTFCVSKPDQRSNILANFKSRYNGLDGKIISQTICPNCKYYEVPDTVLQQNDIPF